MSTSVILFFITSFGALFGFFIKTNFLYLIIIIALFNFFVFLINKNIFNKLLIYSFAFLVTILLANIEESNYQNKLNNLPKEKVIFEGYVKDITPYLEKGKKVIFQTKGYILDNKNIYNKFNINLFLKEGAAALYLTPGDLVRVLAKAYPPKRSLYPSDFDSYSHGLARNIHGFISVKNPKQIIILKKQHKNFIFSNIKFDLTNKLLEYISPIKAGLILALIIGETTLFDDVQKKVYKNIGAGHLLAVSGLQISLLSYLFFSFIEISLSILPFLFMQIHARKIAIIISFILIWLFIGLCGFAPSAMRAALMASIFLFYLFF